MLAHPSSPAALPAGARVLLIGAGRVGTAVTSLLAARGFEIAGVASRTPASAERAAAFLGAPVARLEELPRADLVIIGALDAGIEDMARLVAGGPSAAARVVHLSGASGTRPLQPVIDAGGVAWALHPVQACPDVATAVERLPASAWGVTVSGDLKGAERLIALELAGRPVGVAEAARPLWHAASVMTSNGISALLASGEGMLAALGIEHPEMVLGPLASGTVANARDGGGGAATLTGPIVRGEAATVARHLADLSDEPELGARYKDVAKLILDAAASTGRLDDAARRAMEELLA